MFSIFNFSLFISYAAGSYNSTGLSVSLVLNHRSFVQDWETSASDTCNTCSNFMKYYLMKSLENPEEV